MTQPILATWPTGLAQLIPDHANVQHSRRSSYAVWTTASGTWNLTATHRTSRPVEITIRGPHALVVLDLDQNAPAAIEGHLRILGAIEGRSS